MKVMQLSVFVENKPGHLVKILNVLAKSKINIKTLNIAEATDYGVLRLLVDDPEKGKETFKKNKITSNLTEVVAIEINDKPGALAAIIKIFSEKKLNIEYMYAFTEKIDGKAVMIFRFDDTEKAKEYLEEAGICILERNDILI